MQRIFADKYSMNAWVKGSGWGSWPENTKPYINYIQMFLRVYSIESVVDAGCGDWQFSKLIDWAGVEYKGFDVVPAALQEASQYATDNISFHELDFSIKPLPSADLILVKDVLMHWPPEIVLKFLQRLPECKYVLVTNDWKPDWPFNKECNIGGYQNIDLRAKPYHIEAEEVLEYTLPNPTTGLEETKKVFLIKGPTDGTSITK